MDEKSTKGLGNFENKQPNCTILFIFVYQLSFIGCILSKIVSLDQLWTAFQQKLVTANRKLVFFKMPNTFCLLTVQNYRYFLPCLFHEHPLLYLAIVKYQNERATNKSQERLDHRYGKIRMIGNTMVRKVARHKMGC
jgi:hypothetical protein